MFTASLDCFCFFFFKSMLSLGFGFYIIKFTGRTGDSSLIYTGRLIYELLADVLDTGSLRNLAAPTSGQARFIGKKSSEGRVSSHAQRNPLEFRFSRKIGPLDAVIVRLHCGSMLRALQF